MTTREAYPTDIKQLSALFNSYRVFYGKTPDLEGAEQFLFKRLAQKDSNIYVAENNTQTLVGFVQLYPLFSSTRMQKLWLLNDLFVRPEDRGKGVSVQLIERAKQLVKDSDACGMFLETDKTNDIGNNLYPKTGFKLNTVSNYYEWTKEKMHSS